MKFLLSINYLYWLVLSALFFAVGEFWSKKFALNPKFSYIALVVMIYAFGTLAWLPAILQKNSLSIAGTIWSIMSLFATVLIGVLLFGEKLSVIGIVGMILALIAIVLLYIA